MATAPASVPFSASVVTNSCTSGWLTLAGGVTTLTGLMSPYAMAVHANAGSPHLIPNGSVCTGAITLTPAGGGSSQTVAVTFYAGGPQPNSVPAMDSAALAGLAILLAAAGAWLMKLKADS